MRKPRELNRASETRAQAPSLLGRRGSGALIVEDQADVRDLLVDQVRRLDVEVRSARSGAEALVELAHGAPPDIIILDHDLPDTTGLELCRQIRADGRKAHSHIVMVTGHGELNAANCLEQGVDELIIKPFREETLRAAIRAGLRGQTRARLSSRQARREGVAWLGTVTAHELNNPLASALGNVDLLRGILEAGLNGPAQSAEAKQLLGDVQTALDRIRVYAKNLRKHSQSGGAGSDEFVAATELRDRVAGLIGGTARILDDSRDGGAFDVHLLTHVIGLLIQEATQHFPLVATGLITLNACEVVVLVEIHNPPAGVDPEILLEPRLIADASGPMHFDPGLAHVEGEFVAAGGQLFASSRSGGWRFGFKLPLSMVSPQVHKPEVSS